MAINQDGFEAGKLLTPEEHSQYLLAQRKAQRKAKLEESVVATQAKEVKAK